MTVCKIPPDTNAGAKEQECISREGFAGWKSVCIGNLNIDIIEIWSKFICNFVAI